MLIMSSENTFDFLKVKIKEHLLTFVTNRSLAGVYY